MDHSSNSLDDSNILRKRLLGAAVLIALAVIFLPLLLDGSGTESRFRRVEQLRVEPPRILNESGQLEPPEAPAAAKPGATDAESAKPVAIQPRAAESETIEPKVDKPEARKPKPAPEALTAADSTPEVIPTPTIALPTQPVNAEAVTTTPAPVAGSGTTPSAQSGPGSAWVIQAGSFSDEANALALRDQVRAAGYPAFVSSKGEGTDSQTLFRVKVGPITEREKAATVQSDLQTLLGQKTLIRQYP